MIYYKTISNNLNKTLEENDLKGWMMIEKGRCKGKGRREKANRIDLFQRNLKEVSVVRN